MLCNRMVIFRLDLNALILNTTTGLMVRGRRKLKTPDVN